MSDTRQRVQINYKSGISVVVECDELTVKRNQLNGALSLEWSGMTPNPIVIGVSDIESIYDLGPEMPPADVP